MTAYERLDERETDAEEVRESTLRANLPLARVKEAFVGDPWQRYPYVGCPVTRGSPTRVSLT
jgi:hypothetical protein